MATGFTPSLSSSFSDKEKTNHTRLSRLLTDIGRRVLQDVFDSIHPPSSLHGVLNSVPVQNQLQRFRSRKILPDQQWKTLYPTSGIAESKNFNITLLFLLLRNICGLRPPPSTGSWDKEPLSVDLCIEADLVRIKRYRNELYAHKVEIALTDDEFEKHWDDIEKALNRLVKSRYKDQIEQLKFASMDHEKDKCFMILWQKWKESERVMRYIDEAVAKGNVEIIQTIEKMNQESNEIRYQDDNDKMEFLRQEIQKLNEEDKGKRRVADLEILTQMKDLHALAPENKRKKNPGPQDPCVQPGLLFMLSRYQPESTSPRTSI